MKTTTNFNVKTVTLAAFIAMAVSAASAMTMNKSEAVVLDQTHIATVTIIGERMSPEEKLEFDLAQLESSEAIKTIVISAKRLSDEQKLNMDKQEESKQVSMNTRALNQSRNG